MDAADHLVMIDLAFDGAESEPGAHSIQLGLAGTERPHAVASFPIPGFTGGHVVADSPYCNSLEF